MTNYLIGRGAQLNPHNKFELRELVIEELEGIDEEIELKNPETKFYQEKPKLLVNKVNSPDIPLPYSINPYQGCEHGCIYCYARNSHQYWGFSAGVDFESKIIVKKNAPELLETFLKNKKYQPKPIMLSGNTDCYQPIERKLKITRELLKIFLNYKNPVGLITKNYMILRDMDILKQLAAENLVHVNISITTLDKDTHRLMEPRTASPFKRLKTVNELAKNGIPVNVMVAPIIPGINDHEIPEIIKEAALNGAKSAVPIFIRLNGKVKEIFEDWLIKNFPLKADKVMNKIAELHGGKVSDSRFGTRMKGEGKLSDILNSLFKVHYKRYFENYVSKPLNTSLFKRPSDVQMSLF